MLHYWWKVKLDTSSPALYATILGALLASSMVCYPRTMWGIAERGYARGDETSLQLANAERVARLEPRTGVRARCDAALSDSRPCDGATDGPG